MVGLSNVITALLSPLTILEGLFPNSPSALGSPSDNTTITSPHRWLSLPATPSLPNSKSNKGQYAHINGIDLWYNVYSSHKAEERGRPPVMFMHGGLSNSDYWGLQVEAVLKKGYKVVVLDSRTHGRSGRDENELGYDLMADDCVKLLDHLNIPTASLVGWSDGAINALNIAAKHPKRADRVFAFAANYNTSGTKDVTQSHTFMTFIDRTKAEYALLSPTPSDYDLFLDSIFTMWASQPDWNSHFFKRIDGKRVWIVDGDLEEAVKRYQQEDMAKWIFGSGLLILPQTSHFAFIQDPGMFNDALLRFLELEFE